MAQLQFFYIGKSYGSQKLEGNTFKAYKYKDKETNKVILYPIITMSYDPNPKEIFIYGVGYKKIGKSVVEVPVFDGDSEHWDDYIERYGIRCLYYSIDGSEYDSNDCCHIKKQIEFKSILKYGINNFVDFIDKFIKMSDIQIKIIKEKYAPLISNNTCRNIDTLIEEEYKFKPCYNMFYSYFIVQYSPDVIEDDKRMVQLYRDYREAQLKLESKDYQEALKVEKQKFALYNELKGNHAYNSNKVDEFYRLDEKCNKLFNKAYKPIKEQINKEINTDNDIFPTSVEDKVKYLFGNEVSEIYDYLVETYLNTEKD